MHSETYSIESNRASLRVRRADVDGKPILLVHGGPGGTDYLFKFFAKPLKDHGYRAISFVQRGSPGSPSEPPFLINDFIEDIEAIRRSVGCDRFALLGHSWGGLLSTLYAAKYPERIERLVLVCPIGARAGWRRQFEQEIERRMSPQELRTFRQLLRDAENAATNAEREHLMVKRLNIAVYSYYSPQHREGKPGLAHMEFRVREAIMNQLDALYGDAEWENGLNHLEAPIAVLYGTDDPIPEKVVQDYAAMLPHANVIALHGLGHFPWMEDHGDFMEALDYALRENT